MLLNVRYFRRRNYFKFIKKWKEYHYPHEKIDYFIELSKLVETIPNSRIPILYSPNTIIETAYPTIEAFLDNVKKVLGTLDKNAVKPQLPLEFSKIELGAWLETNDGYAVQYESAITVVGQALTDLYKALYSEKNLETYREYVFKQYRELFLSGINFYLTIVQEDSLLQ